MTRIRNYTALAIACWFLTACAALGIAPAQNLEQKIAYAQGVNTAVLTSSTAALRAQQITGDDHEHVIKIAEQAKALTDSARLLSATDTDAAARKLQMATVILTELQTWLNSRKRT